MLPIDSGARVSASQDSILDQNSLNSIKSLGRQKDPEAIREVAKKFEAMFVQQMLKTMRDTNDVFAQDSYFSSNEEHFHRDMMDQQMVLNLTSGKGIGLAEQFYRNMMQTYGNQMNQESTQTTSASGELTAQAATAGVLPEAVRYSMMQHALADSPAQTSKAAATNDAADTRAMESFMSAYYGKSAPFDPYAVGESDLGPVKVSRVYPGASSKMAVTPSQQAFIAMLKPHAEKAAQELNIKPDVLLAQAALETGWGKHVIHARNGENSFNLFNIKSSNQWRGDSVNVATLEYKEGLPAYERANFRKYNNYAESFADYVKLMKNNGRYEQALATGKNSAAYADALQRAGYATDPQYAAKIKSLMKTDVIVNGLAESAQSILSYAGRALGAQVTE